MSQNIAPHKKKEFISKQLKFAITAASIAGTLGLWGIFSKADVKNTTVQPTTDSTLPTVATLVSVNIVPVVNTTVSTTSDSNSTSVNVLPVVTQPPVTVVATAAPVVIQQPAPVTSSHSSH
jgi:hypothetical protein